MRKTLVEELTEIMCESCANTFNCRLCTVKEDIQRVLDNNRYGTRPRRKVYCITTDREFNTIKEASDYYGVVSATISKCCKGELKRAGSLNGQMLEWRYSDEGKM